MLRLTLRPLITAALIATIAPLGLAVLGLEQAAYAKNGNGGGNGGGNGNGNGGGNGGGHGNGNGGGNGGGSAGGQAKTADVSTETDAVTQSKPHKPSKVELADDDPSLSPSALGKLNGVLHASPTALANASANSPIGKARVFGEELSAFFDAVIDEDETTTEDETATDEVTVEDLGALMAGMTNKPVTAAQVQAVVDRLAADNPEDDSLQDIDPDLAQEIADEANEIHGFDTTAEADDSEETAEIVN